MENEWFATTARERWAKRHRLGRSYALGNVRPRGAPPSAGVMRRFYGPAMRLKAHRDRRSIVDSTEERLAEMARVLGRLR